MRGQMKVLLVGSGGREDALASLISRSPWISLVYCAPGNDGIGQRPKTLCLPGLKADDIFGLRDFANSNGIGLTVVGPEAPLVAGITDAFKAVGLKIVGPTKVAAQLEGSKVFTKKFMAKYGIPTADFMDFDDPKKARRYATANLPCVIKADGLASGKGVIPCHSKEDVSAAIKRIMVDKEFKESGNRVVVEEFLVGEEATFMVLTDGFRVVPLLATQDHKPVFDGDRGPNTGGMGAYAPAPVITKELERQIMETIILPTITGIKIEGKKRKENWVYRGILYAGLMIVSTPDGPRPMVLEFNVRFGDPELQPLALLMESDVVPYLLGIAEGRLPDEKIKWREGAAVCVVMASKGYPGTIKKGQEIYGLEKVVIMKDSEFFCAGVKKENGVLKTAGGRVLGVTARAEGIPEAIDLVYRVVAEISWKGEHHRKDIGLKALKRGVQVPMGL